MGSLNKAMVIGNLGRDAEVKVTPSGQSVASFSVATTETWTKDGEKKEKTEWHRIVLWGKTADALQPYLTAGKQVYVEGQLQTRQWEKDGQKHYSTEIRADRIVLLGGGKRGESAAHLRDEDVAAASVSDSDIPF
jgi:single-strand DNA-binding protein